MTAATLSFPHFFPTSSISGDGGGGVYIDIHPPTVAAARRWIWAGYYFALAIITYECIITSTTQQTRKSTHMKQTQKIGPKHQLVNPMPRNLMLTEAVIDKARRIGKGNLSAGVRRAVTEYKEMEK